MENVKKSKFVKAIRKYWFAYIIGILVLAYYLLFSYGPMYGILSAFQNYKPIKGIWGSEWVGFDNFVDIFTNVDFYKAIRNSLLISSLRLLLCFWAPLILAILLNEIKRRKVRTVYQTFLYLPHFISWAVIGGLVTMFLQASGLFNKIGEALGFETRYYMMESGTFLPVILLTDIWKNAGWGTIVYIAAMQNINPELYEAASLDGASRFKQIIHVTLPGMMPMISLYLILAVANILSAGFDQILVFQDVDYEAKYSLILDLWVYNLGMRNTFQSLATAAGLFKSIISTILLVVADRVCKKMGQRGIV